MAERYIVIMAGGKGERFWPASRLRRPKQLLPIVGDTPMLSQTIDRLTPEFPASNIFVITNAEQLVSTRGVCSMLPARNVVAEPEGRDTAAAVGLAMLLIKSRDKDAALAMLPADALIKDKGAFCDSLKLAFEAAEQSPSLLTIGIKPTEPATGYGYIQAGSEVANIAGSSVFAVKEFKEKPRLEVAKRYLESGDYFWNAGMFVWKVATIEAALAEHTPGLKAGLDLIESGLSEGKDFDSLLADLYPKLEKISVDFAIMEKADNVRTIEATFDWDDVGSWNAIERHFPADEQENVTNGDAVYNESNRNIVVSGDNHLIALVGVDDLIVVRTDDATIVCKKSESQKIKDVVKHLASSEKHKGLV